MVLPERNIKKYPWALNEVKLDRAVNELIAEGVDFGEAEVKARYIKFAGALKKEEIQEEKPKKGKKVSDDSEEEKES